METEVVVTVIDGQMVEIPAVDNEYKPNKPKPKVVRAGRVKFKPNPKSGIMDITKEWKDHIIKRSGAPRSAQSFRLRPQRNVVEFIKGQRPVSTRRR